MHRFKAFQGYPVFEPAGNMREKAEAGGRRSVYTQMLSLEEHQHRLGLGYPGQAVGTLCFCLTSAATHSLGCVHAAGPGLKAFLWCARIALGGCHGTAMTRPSTLCYHSSVCATGTLERVHRSDLFAYSTLACNLD